MKLFGWEIEKTKKAQLATIFEEPNKALDVLKEINLQIEQKAFQPQNNIVNFNIASYPQWNARREVLSYVEIDDIYSIISLLATTAATIPLVGYSVKSDADMKQYKRFKKDTLQKKHFRTKALEDLSDNDPVNQLLQNPNGSQFEFFEMLYTLLFINGEVFIWKEKLKFGVNKGTTYKLHILFPTNMTVFVSTGFPQGVTGYRYLTPYGSNIDFETEEIIHIKYANPRSLYTQQYRGMSPLTPFSKRISLSAAILDTQTAQVQNGGVPGIVFDETLPGTTAAKEANDLRKTAYVEYSNNLANKGAPYFASGKLGFVALGLKLVDMDTTSLSKENLSKIANGFHVSTILLNDTTSSTESNVQIQTKRMYTNTILPNIKRVEDALTNGLFIDFKGPKRIIEADISGVTELQEDMAKQATALALMWWISPNEKRQIQGFDKSDEEYMDDMLVSNQLILLDDLGGVTEPVEEPTDPNLPNPNNPDPNNPDPEDAND